MNNKTIDNEAHPESETGSRSTGVASLRVLFDNKVVFSSEGKWLHPLFELEEFLQTSPLDPASLTVEDKIIGKAAAMLMVRMGLRTVHGAIMSRLAESVFVRQGTSYSFDRLVERIDCRTESLLADEEDLERAYALVLERAKR